MKTRYALALMLGMAGAMVDTSDAQAQYGVSAGIYGGYGGYGYDVGQLYRVLAENVPYFSAFPPVYYSAPVPRSYGYSPFAYPPGVMTPDVVKVAPQEILNPHVPAETSSASEESTKVTAWQPLTIENPYVTSRLAQKGL